MRDHKKLRAFALADKLALPVYEHTQTFPPEEKFGLISQMRRCAVSIPSNIVEGCARSTQKDYVRFLEIAYGSARELDYQLSLATRLGFLHPQQCDDLIQASEENCEVLNGLINALRKNKS